MGFLLLCDPWGGGRGREGFCWLSCSGLSWALMRRSAVTHTQEALYCSHKTHNLRQRRNPFYCLLPCVSLKYLNYTHTHTHLSTTLMIYCFTLFPPFLPFTFFLIPPACPSQTHTDTLSLGLWPRVDATSGLHQALTWSKCVCVYVKGPMWVCLCNPQEKLPLIWESVLQALKHSQAECGCSVGVVCQKADGGIWIMHIYVCVLMGNTAICVSKRNYQCIYLRGLIKMLLWGIQIYPHYQALSLKRLCV